MQDILGYAIDNIASGSLPQWVGYQGTNISLISTLAQLSPPWDLYGQMCGLKEIFSQ